MIPTEYHSRFADLVDQRALNHHPITVVGAGGLGSPTVLALAKMGAQNLEVFDPGLVEAVNVGTQLYGPEHALHKVPKVAALAEICQNLAGVHINGHQSEFPLNERLTGIVIVTVDSMAARNSIWRAVLRNRMSVEYLIEARMGAEQGRVYAIKPVHPAQAKFYGNNALYTDAEAIQEPCTAKATGYAGLVLGGFIASTVQKVVMHRPVEPEVIIDLVLPMILTPTMEQA